MSKKKNSLPTPAGFRILLKPRELQEKTAGGIILVDETKHHQKLATNISQVVAMGPVCYEDKSQKWCNVGDWVLTGKYVGSKLRYDEEDYVIINDDEVIGLVPDPDKISLK